MSELTHAEFSQDRIFDVGRWVDLRGGTLYLLDPATAEPLNPAEPPVWLASDPRLAEGYEALGDPAHNHKLVIAPGRHGWARDLGRFENRFTWFERTYARSHALAIEESDGWDREAWGEVLQTLRSSSDQLSPDFWRSDTFVSRAPRSAVRHQHVAEFSYDLEKTTTPIDALLLEMNNPDTETSRLQHMEFPIRKILMFAAVALREWYIPGKYMHELINFPRPNGRGISGFKPT